MPKKAVWSDGQDAQIRRLRTEGASWDVIAYALGLARWTVIERARALGVGQRLDQAPATEENQDREPLPAGHPDSWTAINRGTTLEDVPYRASETIR